MNIWFFSSLFTHAKSERGDGHADRNNRYCGKLLQLKLRGMFKKGDYDRIIQIAKEAIEREGKVQALVILEAFEGWERREDWGDVSFMTEQGRHIEKMAIVGDEKWKVDAFAFTAKGFRATAIEFFTPSRLSEARTWLSS